MTRLSGTSSQATAPSASISAAIVRLDERAAAGGDDDVALGQQLAQDAAARPARKYGSPSCAKIAATVAPLARLDPLVDVLDAPAEPAAQRARDGRLARAHESDEIQLVGLHARSDSSTEKNSGYETAAAPAP